MALNHLTGRPRHVVSVAERRSDGGKEIGHTGGTLHSRQRDASKRAFKQMHLILHERARKKNNKTQWQSFFPPPPAYQAGAAARCRAARTSQNNYISRRDDRWPFFFGSLRLGDKKRVNRGGGEARRLFHHAVLFFAAQPEPECKRRRPMLRQGGEEKLWKTAPVKNNEKKVAEVLIRLSRGLVLRPDGCRRLQSEGFGPIGRRCCGCRVRRARSPPG